MVDAKAIKDKVSKKASNARSKISSHLNPHKHCQMCGTTIDIKADPRVCKADECASKLEKRNKNDRMMRIMFVVFFIAIVAPVGLQLAGFGG
jgi:predicted nucleic acid-binding Zn ribbon protein